MAHDGHLEPAGAVRDGEPDLAEPDEAERLATHLDALERRPLPFAAAHGGVRGRDSPGEAQQQRERMLGGRDRVAGRGIDDRDAGASGRVEVDVVDADTRTTDDDEPRPGLDERRVDPDLAADEQRVVVGDRRPQLVRRQACSDVDVVTSLQDVDALVGDALCDEDAHPAVEAFRPHARWAEWRWTAPAMPLSSTGPTSVNSASAPADASTTAWLTSTSPGRAYSAMREARFTVCP